MSDEENQGLMLEAWAFDLGFPLSTFPSHALQD
jgi:hypothetical protein